MMSFKTNYHKVKYCHVEAKVLKCLVKHEHFFTEMSRHSSVFLQKHTFLMKFTFLGKTTNSFALKIFHSMVYIIM
jgi:hypothetical protein